MPAIKAGPLIRARRRELGLSQEDLADGICAVPTLSRIENGERLPSKNHFDALMERLGYSTVMLDCYIDDKTLKVQDLKYKTQQSYLERDYSRALFYLQQLEPLVEDHGSMDWQFVLYQRILLEQEKITQQQKLERLEEALALSYPHYKTKGLPRVMSYREINILNSMAAAYGLKGNREEAITILEHIRAYYDRHVVVMEETLRTRPMVLYNLSKLLGQVGRYDACIEVCDQGIRIARQTGRCTFLDATLYNRAWALLHRNWEGDRQQAELSLRQACYHAHSMAKEKELNHFRAYYESVFGKLDL